MTAYLLTAEDRPRAHSEEARAKRLESEAERRKYQREDTVLLRRRGMVPLAIADELGISLRRVVAYLEEAGETIADGEDAGTFKSPNATGRSATSSSARRTRNRG